LVRRAQPRSCTVEQVVGHFQQQQGLSRSVGNGIDECGARFGARSFNLLVNKLVPAG